MKPTCKDVVPINAARKFSNPAPILQIPATQEALAAVPGSAVLEIGAGCLRNALHLQSRGFAVSVQELKGIEERFTDEYALFRKRGGHVFFEDRPSRKFEWAIATFVIETICQPTVRRDLVRGVWTNLKPNGFFVLSVRGPKDLVTATATGIRISDGYYTPGRTFSRSFTPDQLHRFLRRCGFSDVRFLHKKSTHAPELLHAIARK